MLKHQTNKNILLKAIEGFTNWSEEVSGVSKIKYCSMDIYH